MKRAYLLLLLIVVVGIVFFPLLVLAVGKLWGGQ